MKESDSFEKAPRKCGAFSFYLRSPEPGPVEVNVDPLGEPLGARRSPWQNGYAERLIGSIRRECLYHVVVFGERQLRHVLLSYIQYYNEMRTHLSLEKDAPVSRAVERAGSILCRPVLGGLHHQYVRI